MDDSDQQHLDDIRTKIRRIAGHKQLSGKQFDALTALIREHETLLNGGIPTLEDIFK